MKPEKALAAFQNALNLSPNNIELKSKIGRALITTHEYEDAIKYYSDALKHDPDKLTLRHELANLYFMLQRYKDAENVLVDMLVKMDKSQELNSLINEVKIYLLLSQVQKGANNQQAAISSLLKARDAQLK